MHFLLDSPAYLPSTNSSFSGALGGLVIAVSCIFPQAREQLFLATLHGRGHLKMKSPLEFDVLAFHLNSRIQIMPE